MFVKIINLNFYTRALESCHIAMAWMLQSLQAFALSTNVRKTKLKKNFQIEREIMILLHNYIKNKNKSTIWIQIVIWFCRHHTIWILFCLKYPTCKHSRQYVCPQGAQITTSPFIGISHVQIAHSGCCSCSCSGTTLLDSSAKLDWLSVQGWELDVAAEDCASWDCENRFGKLKLIAATKITFCVSKIKPHFILIKIETTSSTHSWHYIAALHTTTLII